MAYPSHFAPATLSQNIERIEQLKPDTQPEWGKMNAAQMLAHLNVAYDIETGAIATKPNFIMRFLARTFAKKIVTGPKPYPRNMRTAPVFIVPEEQDFDREKVKLIGHMRRVADGGKEQYDGKENVSFGKLTAGEWSTLYQKHLDHHLTQFGV
ncbi:MAG: DUF1569 domain-containing protein [Lewinella sp.]